MAVFVNTNVSSLNGQRYLTNATNSLTTTYQRLSSGYRINSAKDDAAGLQISDRLTSQINGLNQGNRNASDGIAFLQTVDGAIEEMTNMFQRIRTIAVQANNGTNTKEDKAALQKEVDALQDEVDRIGKQTTFGGKLILSGNIYNSIYKNALDDPKAPADAHGFIDFQLGANAGDTISLTIPRLTLDSFANSAGNTGMTNKRWDVETKASNVLDDMDKCIAALSAYRANFGAAQNRLESTIRNQSNIVANESDARSRIRDADFAEESANLSQQSIIQQAATSMLMQANTRPQLGLSLLS